jgi:preprotein translocase subunit SecD
MTRLLACLCAGLITALAACGGGDDGGPAASIVLTPDLTQLPDGTDPDAARQSIVSILEARADLLDIDAKVELLDDGRISVEAPGQTSEQAEIIFAQQAFLTVAQPLLGPVGQVICQASDGSQVSVSPDSISYPPAGSPQRGTPRCNLGDGTFAQIVWTPAAAVLSGAETALDSDYVEEATLDTQQGPIVIVQFGESGNLLLTSISEQLIGLPLGIFVDGQLLSAPTVSERIITGNLAISSLNEDGARILAAQLSAGPLPAPLTLSAASS